MAAWKPTENQRAAARFARSHSYRATVTALTEGVGVSRAAYYKWFRRPEFRAWWTEQAEMFFTFSLHRVYSVMLARAVGEKPVKGDMRAAEVFMKRFDALYLPKTQQFQPKSVSLEPVTKQVEDEVAQILDEAFEEPPPTPPVGHPPKQPYGEDDDGTPQT